MANAVMHHHQDVQAQEAGRIRNRRAFQAKLFLVLATALFAGFAALAIARYAWLDKFSALSGLVLVVLAAVLHNRWRGRSEERRVGNECCGQVRYTWSPDH